MVNRRSGPLHTEQINFPLLLRSYCEDGPKLVQARASPKLKLNEESPQAAKGLRYANLVGKRNGKQGGDQSAGLWRPKHSLYATCGSRA